jgi:sarcosine oxidase delta subunit
VKAKADQIEEWGKQHGCGEWFSTSWRGVDSVNPTEQDVLAALGRIGDKP